MTTPQNYPTQSGDFTVIGPECFTNEDATLIEYKGSTYRIVPEKRTATLDWSNPEYVRAEYERTGFNRMDEVPAGTPISEMTSAQVHAMHYAAKREQALAAGAQPEGRQNSILQQQEERAKEAPAVDLVTRLRDKAEQVKASRESGAL